MLTWGPDPSVKERKEKEKGKEEKRRGVAGPLSAQEAKARAGPSFQAEPTTPRASLLSLPASRKPSQPRNASRAKLDHEPAQSLFEPKDP